MSAETIEQRMERKAMEEILWTSTPDWDCPHCRTTNLAIRQKCRCCGYDSNAGEFPYYNPMPPYEGAPQNPTHDD